jgi:hypothetical protein
MHRHEKPMPASKRDPHRVRATSTIGTSCDRCKIAKVQQIGKLFFLVHPTWCPAADSNRGRPVHRGCGGTIVKRFKKEACLRCNVRAQVLPHERGPAA